MEEGVEEQGKRRFEGKPYRSWYSTKQYRLKWLGDVGIKKRRWLAWLNTLSWCTKPRGRWPLGVPRLRREDQAANYLRRLGVEMENAEDIRVEANIRREQKIILGKIKHESLNCIQEKPCGSGWKEWMRNRNRVRSWGSGDFPRPKKWISPLFTVVVDGLVTTSRVRFRQIISLSIIKSNSRNFI